MLKNKKLTYISLFSSGGVGCYGFNMEGFRCIASNEILPKRIDVQKANKICELESGYIVGDIATMEVKEKIYKEVQTWKSRGNDRIDVVIATPPCQGISVINHKKNATEIQRNSLVVDSIEVIKNIKPRVLIFENVMAFQKTLCTTPDNRNIKIGDYIVESLGNDYVLTARVLNLMNYGSNSSRTRTILIGVDKKYRDSITPYDLFPEYSKEKTLQQVIKQFSPLIWGEIDKTDFYHAFRIYDPKMRGWISELKEGESAFDNSDIENRPHRYKLGERVENSRKNRDKYTRQLWNRFIQCVHTRNDQLAAQNTIHPEQDRVFSIRELMEMMTIPADFKWMDMDLPELNSLTEEQKRKVYKQHELTIRQCIGEAVPTEAVRRIASNIKSFFLGNALSPVNLNTTILQYDLEKRDLLISFLKTNPLELDVSILMRIAELCNAKRDENAAFYTNKFIVNEIVARLPDFNKNDLRILEPSVGAGNMLPFLFKKYGHINEVFLDLVDIDPNSIETLQLIIEKLNVPNNFKIRIYCQDFLDMEITERYDLIIGNPPFSKIPKSSLKKLHYFTELQNTRTTNLSALFLEKCIKSGDCVALILNKTILSNLEFQITRNILADIKIDTIIDFGRHGFTGVSIETICLLVNPRLKPKETVVYNMKHNKEILQKQQYITDEIFPSFIIYRDETFDKVAMKLEFGVFEVFRDRQITKGLLSREIKSKSLKVIKAKYIDDAGGAITGGDDDQSFIAEDVAKELAAYKFVNNKSVYLTPNMTYNPRLIENQKDTISDGSTAILIPKYAFKLTVKQLNFFSSSEYRRFYSIARNLSTQSINVDKISVFYYGKLIEYDQ